MGRVAGGATTRRQFLSVLAGASLPLLSACSTSVPEPTSAATPTSSQAAAAQPAAISPATVAPATASISTLKFAYAGGLASGGLYIALDRGYLHAAGLSFEEVRFDTSATMIPSLSTGQVDFGIGGVAAGLFNSIAQGIAVRLVLDAWTAAPGNGAGGLLVRQDLIDAGRVHGLADLRALRVAVTSKGQATEYALAVALSQVGMSTADVDVTELSYPNMTVALASRNIDAAITIEPFATQAILQNVATRLKTLAELSPNFSTAMVIFSPSLVEARAEQARRLAAAYVHGVRDYEAARTSGQDKDEIITILTSHLDVKDRALYDRMPWPSIDPNGRLNSESLAAAQAWFVKQSYVPKPVDLTQVIDPQFANYAVSQLGPYHA